MSIITTEIEDEEQSRQMAENHPPRDVVLSSLDRHEILRPFLNVSLAFRAVARRALWCEIVSGVELLPRPLEAVKRSPEIGRLVRRVGLDANGDTSYLVGRPDTAESDPMWYGVRARVEKRELPGQLVPYATLLDLLALCPGCVMVDIQGVGPTCKALSPPTIR